MKCELLAPAGSIEALHAALMAGADACYIGGSRFGARAYASNPEEEELLEAIDLVHRLGKKLYMTVNTLVKDAELERELYAWMKPYVERGLDGVIIQDFGAVELFRRMFPTLPLHASTQMAVTGPEGAAFLKKAGLVRVVPARELSLPEICRIREETGIEVETFVHGAMCYSYSGMCLMSSLIGGRSGNRGRCAGVCRLPFDVYDGKRHMNGPDTHYPLNMKDMCTVDLIPELIEAGICSFKIEGRMKKPEYTAGVVSIYRKYMDLYEQDPGHFKVSEADRRYLWELFNRDGFNQSGYHQHNGRDMIALRNEKLNDVRQKAAQELLTGIRAQLADKEWKKRLQAPVEGVVVLYEGQPAGLTVTWTDPKGLPLSVYVEGAEVQTAKNQPLTEDRIRRQMEKTGESDFRFASLDVQAGNSVFIPMQNLNELRRQAFAELKDVIRAFYSREVLEEDAVRCRRGNMSVSGSMPTVEKQEAAYPAYWTEITSPVQLSPVLDLIRRRKESIGVCLPYGFFAKSTYISSVITEEKKNHYLQQIREGKIPVRMALPFVVRNRNEKLIREAVRNYRSFEGERAGVLVRNLEELGMLFNEGAAEEAVLDSMVYTWNSGAQQFFGEYGFRTCTVTPELNERELQKRNNGSSELEIYGRVPMMISAHCLRKTLDHCDHKNSRLVMKDRKGTSFPAVSCCDDCCSIIYNSLPTSLLRDREAVKELQMKACRLHFTEETEWETAEVLKAFEDLWLNRKKDTDARMPESTRGHFRRGVE